MRVMLFKNWKCVLKMLWSDDFSFSKIMDYEIWNASSSNHSSSTSSSESCFWHGGSRHSLIQWCVADSSWSGNDTHVYFCPKTTQQRSDDFSFSRIMDYEIWDASSSNQTDSVKRSSLYQKSKWWSKDKIFDRTTREEGCNSLPNLNCYASTSIQCLWRRTSN